MTDRRRRSTRSMLLPGLLDSRADERRAIARLRAARRARTPSSGARDFGAYGFTTFGIDYNQALGAYLRGAATRVERRRRSSAARPPARTRRAASRSCT